jgi:hypothetical protein
MIASPLAHAAPPPSGNYGCDTGTIAATGAYYAQETTCIAVGSAGTTGSAYGVQVKSTTRCYKSGVLYPCTVINGDTVQTWLLEDIAGSYEVINTGHLGESDCPNCKTKTHWGTPCYTGEGEPLRSMVAYAASLRVCFANGVCSKYHDHYSDFANIPRINRCS